MKKYLALAFLCLLGCSTKPAARPQPVPAARRFESSLLKPSHRRTCAIHIVREPGDRKSGLNLFLDGDQIARISPRETMTVYVTPGRHLLAAGQLFSPPATMRVVLQKGDVTTIRIIDRGGNFELKPTHRSLAQ